MNIYTDEEWEYRLNNIKSEKAKKAIKRIYSAYPEECLPQGICDPAYIINVIAYELGVGDGKGNFWIPDAEVSHE